MSLPARFLAAQSGTSPFFEPLADTGIAIEYDAYTASECLAAVERVGNTVRRTQTTLRDAWEQSFLENDTVLTAQRHTAAKCSRHLVIDRIPPRDLPDLARIYWFIGDTASMAAAINYRIRLDASDSAKAVTYRQLLTRFVLSSPRDVPFALKTLLPALERLTSLEAQTARFRTHVALAHNFAASRLPDAGTVSMRHIDAALQEFERLPAIVQSTMVDTVGPLFRLGAATATERGDTARSRALLDIARRLLPKLPNGARYTHQAEAIVRYYGMTAPPLHADFIYGAPQGAEQVKTWPRAGRWTLVAPLPSGGRLAGFYKNLRKSLGDSIDFVFFMPTNGYWKPHGPLSASEEAQLAYDYLSNRWGIGGTLLVEERMYRKLPDGRKIGEAIATPSIYQQNGLVIGPDGTIRAMIEPATVVRFDLLLQSLMNQTPAINSHRTDR